MASHSQHSSISSSDNKVVGLAPITFWPPMLVGLVSRGKKIRYTKIWQVDDTADEKTGYSKCQNVETTDT